MEIFNQIPIQKDKFKNTANKLLINCFILKRKDDTRNDYYYIIQNKEFFREYFDLLGYRLEINETQGFITLYNTQGTGRLRLKLLETIFLLILRLLYVEKRKEISLNEDVIITTEEIQTKYNMLKIQSKQYLDKTMIRDNIRLFKRYNILTNMDSEMAMPDSRIKIYPSVLFTITNSDLTELADEIKSDLNKYINGGESNDDEETMQD
jgi:hypothetical protein